MDSEEGRVQNELVVFVLAIQGNVYFDLKIENNLIFFSKKIMFSKSRF